MKTVAPAELAAVLFFRVSSLSALGRGTYKVKWSGRYEERFFFVLFLNLAIWKRGDLKNLKFEELNFLKDFRKSLQ